MNPPLTHKKHYLAACITALTLGIGASGIQAKENNKDQYFKRIATFPIYKNLDLSKGDNIEDETVAEIVAASTDGKTLIYTNGQKERLGFVNIKNPRKPKPAGFLQLSGEPTSVAIHNNYALVGVNTSADFVSPSGNLVVVDISNINNPTIVASLPMNGQPDSVAVSPAGPFAAVVIENERDEDLNDGEIPQLPAGFLNVVKMVGAPASWTVSMVDMTGLADVAPSDPEPEFVDINRNNIAVVSMQENNHIVLVDMKTAAVIDHFNAGSVELNNVDNTEEGVISPTETLTRVREPDALKWINNYKFATANEGDYEGGSRSFTVFGKDGEVKYEAAESVEHLVMRAGHYPEDRSANKGGEPEGIEFATYGNRDLLFVGSERANTVAVYDANNPYAPQFHQLLPTGVGPEGLLAIPQRNLFVAAAEKDDAGDGFRSTLSIFKLKNSKRPFYPQIKSTDADLIPWGALSGLAADTHDRQTLYAVHDSYYSQSRIFTVDVSSKPAIITGQTVLSKDGATVDYDLEGIATANDGGFWLVSEAPVGQQNLLIKTSANGTVEAEYALPAAVHANQVKFGFEGVAAYGEKVIVAFQREWATDPAGQVRLGVFDPASGEWTFVYYPIDAAPAGWVGLSEITALGGDEFLILERDNQQGPSAAIKRIYRVSLAGVTPVSEGEKIPMLGKTLVRDILPDMQKTNGWVVDKVEGMAVNKKGRVYVVTDNDGVDDATGETRFIRLGKILN